MNSLIVVKENPHSLYLLANILQNYLRDKINCDCEPDIF